MFLCLTSLSMIISRFIHIASNNSIEFFFMAEWCSTVYVYLIFFIHSSVYGHLGCFHVQGCTIVSSPYICVHSLPSLIKGWICSLEFREGQGGWMKSVSYKQEMKDTEGICTWETHRVLLGFNILTAASGEIPGNNHPPPIGCSWISDQWKLR